MAPNKEALAQPAPWEVAAPNEQLFVLVTGANSGIGLGIGERLIDEFLATRSLTSHLVLLPTARSATKCRETIHTLRAHAINTAKTSKVLPSRAGGDDEYKWEDAAARIHILSLQLDLCDIGGVYGLADELCNGTVSNPEGVEGQDAQLRDVRVPRLDTVVWNAAYGGWSGVQWVKAIWTILTKGIVQSVTWPTFKKALPTRLLNEQPNYGYPAKPLLGEVFTSCVFGHYLFGHRLLPILSRPSGSPIAPGRIVWASSVEAVHDVFDPSDIQCFYRDSPYESAKRLTDILSLSHTLPSVRKYADDYFNDEDEEDDDVVPPKMYLTHPSVIASTLFPVPWFLFWAYKLALSMARWLGSPWHAIDAYGAAKSATWVALQDQDELDALDAERVKWGSCTNVQGEVTIKKTEVEGWGWTGKVEDVTKDEEGEVDLLRKSIGRKKGVVGVTEESLATFEEVGADCWKQLEDLREEWEEVLDL